MYFPADENSLESSLCDLRTYVEEQFRTSCQLRFLVSHLSLPPYSLAFFLDFFLRLSCVAEAGVEPASVS